MSVNTGMLTLYVSSIVSRDLLLSIAMTVSLMWPFFTHRPVIMSSKVRLAYVKQLKILRSSRKEAKVKKKKTLTKEHTNTHIPTNA